MTRPPRGRPRRADAFAARLQVPMRPADLEDLRALAAAAGLTAAAWARGVLETALDAHPPLAEGRRRRT